MAARRIRISAGPVSADAELNDTRAAEAIWRALPLQAKAETWGDEIYFAIGLALGEERPQAVVGLGDLGYWPPGRAFCIFFGPTPASRGDEIRPASAVTVVGRVAGDATVFRRVRTGDPVRIERANGAGR
ncbi:MAG TPA: cyclophilin-like fold protein [Candidatus Binatia bacterium]|nr:cyclophilin-like fold protein [Candidatus Binatia bacterium]